MKAAAWLWVKTSDVVWGKKEQFLIIREKGESEMKFKS